MDEVDTHITNKGFCSMHSWEYIYTDCNRIKTADTTHWDFHLVRFPNPRRFNLSRDTVDCQINVPISTALNNGHHREVLLKKTPQTL